MISFAQHEQKQDERIIKRDTKEVIKQIADRIVSETTYKFIDTETGETFASTKGLEP